MNCGISAVDRCGVSTGREYPSTIANEVEARREATVDEVIIDEVPEEEESQEMRMGSR